MKKLLIATLFLVSLFGFQQKAEATAYYVDETPGWVAGVGTATTTAFANLDAFVEAARNPGDIVFVRRVATTTARTFLGDLNPTSDGSAGNPIIISADYDNLWSDFATSTQTYSVALATTTLYASGSITGIAAGDWIYVEGDCYETYSATELNRCEYAYEVKTVSGTALTIYFPYEGRQSGSGLYLRVMPDAPIWNSLAGDFEINIDTDEYWLIKGLDLRGTDANGIIEMDSLGGVLELFDVSFKSNGVTAYCLQSTDDYAYVYTSKIRMFDCYGFSTGTDSYPIRYGRNIYYDGNNTANLGLFVAPSGTSLTLAFFENVFMTNQSATQSEFIGGLPIYLVCRSCNNLSGADQLVWQTISTHLFLEDFYGKGKNYQTRNNPPTGNTFLDSSNTNKETPLMSTTTTRVGGGSSSIRVQPYTEISNLILGSRISNIKLFEYPIYADTSSKQYSVYFKTSTTTSAWTSNPTNEQLWIECDFWANTSGFNYRATKKSTGVIDFAGSSDWQSLSVTCQPTAEGILYLRGWYAKPQETGKLNQFLIDGTPVISTP